MPTEFKDYYATLGIPRDATDEDIKKAFRKLARVHHPDVSKDKADGGAKFKEINEANEVLSDPLKRRKYDELGSRGPEHQPVHPRSNADPGGESDPEFHFTGTGFSDFFEQYFGAGRQRGFYSGAPNPEREPRTRARPGADIEGELLVTLDEVMHGALRSLSLQTTDPKTGNSETHSFQVRIPAGATDGRRIRVPGKGEPGQNGAMPGDLYLRVRFAAHPDFQTRGADLYCEVNLAPWEAVLGTAVLAPAFEGAIKVKIPPGTQEGAQLRVRGHGLPKGRSGERGDLYVISKIQVPLQPSENERKLWEELGRVSQFKPREST